MFAPGGLAKVLRALNKEIAGISFVSQKGLIKAGLYIQRNSQLRTPVDTGNLKASAFTIWPAGEATTPTFSNKKGQAAVAKRDHTLGIREAKSIVGNSKLLPGVVVGYTAAYALYVHENMKARHSDQKVKATGRKVKVGKVEIDEYVKGEAKFLENAVKENRKEIVAFIVNAGKERK